MCFIICFSIGAWLRGTSRHALGKVGKQGMPLQDEQRQYSAFVMERMFRVATDGYSKSFALPFVLMSAINFQKAAAYCHHRLTSRSSAWCCWICTLPIISLLSVLYRLFIYYLWCILMNCAENVTKLHMHKRWIPGAPLQFFQCLGIRVNIECWEILRGTLYIVWRQRMFRTWHPLYSWKLNAPSPHKCVLRVGEDDKCDH